MNKDELTANQQAALDKKPGDSEAEVEVPVQATVKTEASGSASEPTEHNSGDGSQGAWFFQQPLVFFLLRNAIVTK